MGEIIDIDRVKKELKCPKILKGEAVQLFYEYARQLMEWKVWKPIYAHSLAMMCLYQLKWQELSVDMEDEDDSIEDARGSKKRNPKASLQKQAFEHYFKLAQSFGLTPVDSKKITIVENGKVGQVGKQVSFR